tara:strand:+ start:509 stop:712 length:204 start_codon:yes stop_codon:yes gene_type:complete
MNNKKRSYTIYGNTYDCYFYNNGYDEGVSVFNDKGDLLFKFDEKINASQIVFLLKGYSKGSRGITKV